MNTLATILSWLLWPLALLTVAWQRAKDRVSTPYVTVLKTKVTSSIGSNGVLFLVTYPSGHKITVTCDNITKPLMYYYWTSSIREHVDDNLRSLCIVAYTEGHYDQES